MVQEHRREINVLRESWRIAESDLQLTARVAAGAFGEVWKGRWEVRPGEAVAVKKIFMTPDSIDELTANVRRRSVSDRNAIVFRDKEIELMMRTRHRRVVFFFGAGQMQRGNVFLVSEFMHGGDLTTRIMNRQPLSWPQRVQIAADVAEGMAFLHGRLLLHRDLKSMNVLLDQHGRAKVADFGLSRAIVTSPDRNNSFAWAIGDDGMSSDTTLTFANVAAAAAEGKGDDEEASLITFRGDAATGNDDGGGGVGRPGTGDGKQYDYVGTGEGKYDSYSTTCTNSVSKNENTTSEDPWGKLSGSGDPSSSAAGAICESCEENPATHHCRACDLAFCHDCDEHARNKKFKGHAIKTIENHLKERARRKSPAAGGAGGRDRVAGSPEVQAGLRTVVEDGHTNGGTSAATAAQLSRIESSDSSPPMTEDQGTTAWMAPEVMTGASGGGGAASGGGGAAYGLPADVFSFGVILWELTTRQLPWSSFRDDREISQRVCAGKRPTLPPQAHAALDRARQSGGDVCAAVGDTDRLCLLPLMVRCWDQDPARRPTFEVVFEQLGELVARFGGGGWRGGGRGDGDGVGRNM